MPWELDAQVLAEAHRQRVRRRAQNEFPAPEELREECRQAQMRMRDRWKNDLEDSPYGVRTIGALLPSFDQWLERAHGKIGFRLTQVMTGHGCFGHYLHRIRREVSTVCHECGDPDGTAQHTLEACSRWAQERRTLIGAIGVDDLSLHSVVAAMLKSERLWPPSAKPSFHRRRPWSGSAKIELMRPRSGADVEGGGGRILPPVNTSSGVRG
ncbi:uncharacterized protein LOC134659423 [Cydia amplana]|uniref:uncharacterized protein LOC134659423 n=1 Tax=Cydia amplana TaxID=1869771 RepID=UPI002FE6B79B